MNAPPTASVSGLTPAIRSAAMTTTAIVPSRIRKPTVPAVPGSIRRNSAGWKLCASVRASSQPSSAMIAAVT